ncbi:tetratricopeptide repeat protein [Cryptosporangium phraense]|uniref:Tetratricopeptide repeat protein n=2 Tax=Cryptosporangium phraense TaxID=2593070 RepID=A0A545AWT1_9ACTN|nr:tetratricopeptide repeat protein [Cryptosporangium phraense]
MDLGPVKRRTVLAALLVDVGRPVPVEALIDRVWGDDPPAKAREVLYAHIARIRRLLADSAVVERRSGGYALLVDRDVIDLHRFRSLVADARSDDCPDARRAALLGEALDLWQSTPLADVPGIWATAVREGLEQQRRSAVALWARTESALGHASAVVDRLQELVAAEPLAEPLLVELVRALHLAGRTAEALDTYARARARLIEELGVDPGPELRAAHEAVLRGVPEPEPLRRPVPAQLPADVPAFTGRASALAELSASLVDGSGAVVVSAVSGTAGVGKTALAIRWAHEVRDRFPDGQLYLDLRGYGTEPPVTPSAALAGFLTALGVSARDLPLDVDERAARYRTELSGRRLLVVLDNASSVEQVRPLLPGSPTCATLVTSRDTLAGLVAVHGAHRLILDLLDPAEAVSLLRSLIGPRVDAEPEAARALAEQCGRLPLALRVAAELAGGRPDSTLADLVAELEDHRARLDLLDAGGDPRADVRAVFSWSYQRLPGPAARMFRRLGLHPGPEFDAHAAAALASESLADARQALTVLSRAHLIRGAASLHDLLRAYALAQSDAEDPPAARDAARARLFAYYLAAAGAAMDVLYPAERHRRPPVEPISSPLPTFPTPEDARAWLDRHRPAFLAVCEYTASRGPGSVASALASTLYVYLDNGGHSADALTVHTLALTAAERTGDRAGVAAALSHLGVVYWQIGRYPEGMEHLTRALAVFRELGDRTGEARAVGNLGVISQQIGRYDDAERYHRAALALFGELGDRVGEANTQTNLGDILMRVGRNEQAIGMLREALERFRELGHQGGEATALTNLGEVHLSLDRPAEAAEYLREAVRLFATIGERYGQTCALNGLGEAEVGRGCASTGAVMFTEALALATTIGERAEQARACVGLARAEPESARGRLREALALYVELGSAEAETVRKELESFSAR